MRSVILGLMALMIWAVPAAPAAGQDGLPPNPFARFQSIRLSNGLRVWYAHVPGAAVTSMAVVVAAGRDEDPWGREQTAHMLEHVLLGDRAGRTEAELARELAARGGSHGGYTTAATTVFPVSIPTTEAEYGVRWLYDVVAPRSFGPEAVARNLQPVAMEIGARPRPALLAATDRVLRHRAFAPAPFWLREFGLDVPEERAGAASGLWAITSADLQGFHERWYTPESMVLVVATGAPLEWLQPVILETFGTLPWRPAARSTQVAEPRRGESRRFTWRHDTPGTRVTVRYRYQDPGTVALLRLAFVEDLLRHRLMERLRRGQDKTVYGVAVSSASRANAGFLAVTADVAPGREGEVRAAVDAEIGRLVEAVADSAAFYADRDLLARRVRIEGSAPASLVRWAAERFAATGVEGMPDVGDYYTAVGADSIGAMAARLFAADNRMMHISRPLPVPLPVVVLLGLVPIIAGVRVFRRLALEPADMRRIRFVARVRPAWPTVLVAGLGGALLLVVAVRAALSGMYFAHSAWLGTMDSLVLHAAAGAIALFVAALASFTLLGLVPRKVLVFSDEMRIKSPTYRSIRLPLGRVREVFVGEAPRSRRLRGVLRPAWGTGTVVVLDDASACFVPVADPTSLRDAILDAASVIPLPGVEMADELVEGDDLATVV